MTSDPGASPSSAPPTTVLEALERAALGDRGFTFVEDGADHRWTYRALLDEARDRGARLLGLGLGPGDRVGLLLLGNEDFVPTFLAAVAAGLVPVPLAPPARVAQLEEHLGTLRRILETAGAKTLVVTEPFGQIGEEHVGVAVTTLATVLATPPGGPLPELDPDATALLQFTSGSTSTPKGVVVSHRNLLVHVAAIGGPGCVDLDADRDRTVSWLPMYHDMGLIGFVVMPLYYAIDAWFLQPFDFIKRPALWCDLLHEHRATYVSAPNFGYDLLVKRATDEQIDGWDLSNLRLAFCGAEPVRPSTMEDFSARFARAGLAPTALRPCYGMAEATLAISVATSARPPRIVDVDAAAYRERRVAEPAGDGREVLRLVSCGPPIPGHEVHVVDTDGNDVPEGHEGELVFVGPSVTGGYFQAPEATAAAFREGRLHTGDLGLLLDGEVYVTGRMKDLVIIRGQNHHPHDVEWCIADDPDVRPGRVVAFSRPGASGEELVVALEAKPDADRDALARRVRARVAAEVGPAVSDVVFLEDGELLKTSSGKLRRAAMRQRYLDGELADAR